mmetsp:Transcript_27391/g.84514  ORF Transcript_27391/g.84514 Transcript_27391/m.84514 type:complete len:100 (-) Transcript_27391:160-459(-)
MPRRAAAAGAAARAALIKCLADDVAMFRRATRSAIKREALRFGGRLFSLLRLETRGGARWERARGRAKRCWRCVNFAAVYLEKGPRRKANSCEPCVKHR